MFQPYNKQNFYSPYFLLQRRNLEIKLKTRKKKTNHKLFSMYWFTIRKNIKSYIGIVVKNLIIPCNYSIILSVLF